MLHSTITREVTLTVARAQKLSDVATCYQTSESEVVEKALDVFFTLAERQAWHHLSEASLNRIWDNEQDAVYDNWREMYGRQHLN